MTSAENVSRGELLLHLLGRIVIVISAKSEMVFWLFKCHFRLAARPYPILEGVSATVVFISKET
jgi:hypothetical protein